MLAAVADIYRRTRKPNDIIWNRLVARPLAAVVVVPLARTGITPNQVTFATLPVFLAGAARAGVAARAGARWSAGAAIIELSYVLDCADGQLARLKGTSSPVGAHLDFLMDELKAFALVAAIAVRLWLPAHDPRWLLEGLAGLVVVARRDQPDDVRSPARIRRRDRRGRQPGHRRLRRGVREQAAARRAALRSRCVEALGRFIVHYPSHIWLVALVNRIDCSCTPTWS